MPQLPDWRQQIAAWADAAQTGPTQVLHAVSELAERGLQASGDLSANLIELAGVARMRLATLPSTLPSTLPALPALPTTLAEQMRRRMNPLGLVTQEDIELQSRRQRNRVAAILKEFLEAQRGRDDALRDSLLAELREQLQSFASAIDDEVFDFDEPMATSPRRTTRRARADADYVMDDNLDMVDYEEIVISEDERTAIRRTLLSSNEFDDD